MSTPGASTGHEGSEQAVVGIRLMIKHTLRMDEYEFLDTLAREMGGALEDAYLKVMSTAIIEAMQKRVHERAREARLRAAQDTTAKPGPKPKEKLEPKVEPPAKTKSKVKAKPKAIAKAKARKAKEPEGGTREATTDAKVGSHKKQTPAAPPAKRGRPKGATSRKKPGRKVKRVIPKKSRKPIKATEQTPALVPTVASAPPPKRGRPKGATNRKKPGRPVNRPVAKKAEKPVKAVDQAPALIPPSPPEPVKPALAKPVVKLVKGSKATAAKTPAPRNPKRAK